MLRAWWNRLWGGRNAYVVQIDKPPGKRARAARNKGRGASSQRDSVVADSGSTSWSGSNQDGGHSDHGGSRFAGAGGHFDGAGASGDWGGSSGSGSSDTGSSDSGSSDSGGGDSGGSSD